MHSLYHLHNTFHLLPLLMFPLDSPGVIFQSQLVVVLIARSAVTEWQANESRQSGSAKHAKFHCVFTHVSNATTHSNIISKLSISINFLLHINTLLSLVALSIAVYVSSLFLTICIDMLCDKNVSVLICTLPLTVYSCLPGIKYFYSKLQLLPLRSL